VTDSFQLRNLADVRSWLRAAEHTAHLSRRGRGELIKSGTLMFGKSSRRESLKLYAKGQEIAAHPKFQPALRDLPHAVEWAQGILRAELVLRSMSLKRRGLDRGSAWCCTDGVNFDPMALLRDRLQGMTMTSRSALPAEVLDSLRPSERTAVVAWEAGADLRAIMSRPTFYRLRAKILPHGIDLATVLPKETSNVVPLVRVLEAVPAKVPSWAVGTPLYFEPRLRA
jgi:II/X family phage/plasmid replication protein